MLSILNLKSKGKKKKNLKKILTLFQPKQKCKKRKSVKKILNLFGGLKKLKLLLKKKKIEKKKRISSKFLTILKKINLPNKKYRLKRFFGGNNSLNEKKNLILPMSKVRKLRTGFFNINDSLEPEKTLLSLIKLSEFLKTGSKPENSLEILPFFFQESFLVSSSVETIKRKNSSHLLNKLFLFLTIIRYSKKREKIFKKLKKRKILKNLKKRIIVLKKPKVMSKKLSLFLKGFSFKVIKQFSKTGKRFVKVKKVRFSLLKRKTFLLRRKSMSSPNFREKKTGFSKMRELRPWNPNLKKETVSLAPKQRPVKTPIKNFVFSKNKTKDKSFFSSKKKDKKK